MTGRGYRAETLSFSAEDFLLKDLQCSDMKIDLNSSGNARINVTGNLDIHMSSSGRVMNHGTPLIK